MTITGSPPTPTAPGTATGTATGRRGLAIETGIVALLALLVAVVTTWPLLRDAGHVAHDPFDPAFQAWTIDWVQHALHHPLQLFDANIFAPEPNTLAYSDSLIGIAVPLLPLRWIGLSPIAQVNVALLLGMSTSAAAAYLFGRYVSGSRTIGALTAVAFAFGPFGTLSSGALHATVKAGIPLAALAAWWLAERAERAQPLWPPVLLLVAATAWQLSVSFYPGAYTIAAAIVVLLVRARSLGRRGWLAALAGLAACGVAAGLLALPYLSVRESFPSFDRELANLGPLGADFLHTDPHLNVWGGLLGKGSGWPVYGEPAFPGLALLILGLVGLVAAWRGDTRARRVAVAAVALIAAGALLGLGTAATGWRAWSPYRILFELVPGWRALRATGRGWAVGLLGLGLLAGYGVCAIGRAITQRTTARPTRVLGVLVVVLAVGCVLVEGHADWGDAMVTVRASAVDRALGEITEPGGVLYLPALEPRDPARAFSGFRQAANVYGTTEHHRRTPNGYSGFFPPSWVRTSRIAEKMPNREAIERMRALGVRYVVVRSWARGGAWEPLLDPVNAAPLRFLGEFDGDLLYEVPAP